MFGPFPQPRGVQAWNFWLRDRVRLAKLVKMNMMNKMNIWKGFWDVKKFWVSMGRKEGGRKVLNWVEAFGGKFQAVGII
jgi:hypothetical protein